MTTTQDEIEYRGQKINTFKVDRQLKVAGKWETHPQYFYSFSDGFMSQSLDTVKTHIDTVLYNAEQEVKKK